MGDIRSDRNVQGRFKILSFVKSGLPIFQWAPQYSWEYLFGDLIAGITVVLTAIPQSMAYAAIAGLTPEYGLYSAFIPSFVYIFLGSCRQMTIGPTAMSSLLTYETCGNGYPECVVLVGFWVGIIQLLIALLKLGILVNLISEPVTIGFTAGAALTISSSQIKNFFGLKGPKGVGFLGFIEAAFQNMSSITIGDTIVACSCVVLLLFLKYLADLKRKSSCSVGSPGSIDKFIWISSISRNALVVLICSCVAYIWQDPPFALTGEVKRGLPTVKVPDFELPIPSNGSANDGNSSSHLAQHYYSFWETWSFLGTGPLSVGLISILQNVAIAKAFTYEHPIDATQEMYALGVSHVIASFFSAIPCAGSFTRSAVNNASGVRSPLGGIFTGILMLLALGLLTPCFQYIPKATLSAIIVCAVLPMIKYEALLPMWKVSKIEVVAMLITFVCSLLLGLELGILIGVIISLALHLAPSIKPKIKSRKYSIQFPGSQQELLILEPSDGCSFLSVDEIRSQIILAAIENDASIIVLNCKHIKRLDFTGINALKSLSASIKKYDKNLIFISFHDDCDSKLLGELKDLDVYDSLDSLGDEKGWGQLLPRSGTNSPEFEGLWANQT